VLPSGAIQGNFHQLFNQLVGVLIAWTMAIVVVIGLRVSPEHEVQGLDLSQHGEEGYYWKVST
jgi:Amt family ammonium transporter